MFYPLGKLLSNDVERNVNELIIKYKEIFQRECCLFKFDDGFQVYTIKGRDGFRFRAFNPDVAMTAFQGAFDEKQVTFITFDNYPGLREADVIVKIERQISRYTWYDTTV